MPNFRLPHEEILNAYLAQILQERLPSTVKISPEKWVDSSKRGRHDFKIIYKGIEFVMEASYDKKDAENDAKNRLNKGFINTIALALYYDPSKFQNKDTPDSIKETILNSDLILKIFVPGKDISQSLLKYIYQQNKMPATNISDWISIPFNNFNVFLDLLLEFLVNVNVIDDIINNIEKEIDNFINLMNDFLKANPETSVINDLNILLFSPNKQGEKQEIDNDIVIANAYISILISSILYESIINTYGLKSLIEILNDNNQDPFLTFEQAFKKVYQDIDYQRILEVSIRVIEILGKTKTDHQLTSIIKNIINITSQIISNKAILRQDFIGRLYHKVTGDVSSRKGYATFYTKSQIAILLAILSFYSDPSFNINWSDLNEIKKFKVCDFACGSGTLLSASYIAMLSLYYENLKNNINSINFEDFHKVVIENCIYGYDALEHAVQIASAILALHEPGTRLETMHTYHIPISSGGGLGSLNLLTSTPLELKNVGLKENSTNSNNIINFDFIIMNPPFSRSTAPGKKGSKPSIFGFITSKKDYKILWNAYKDMIKTRILNKNNKNQKLILKMIKNEDLPEKSINPLNAGASLPFIFLADKYLKEGGKISLVLPRSVLSNSSFIYVRGLIIAKYKIDYIIYSSEEGNYNFSYSTNLSEILLIISRKKALENSNLKIIELKEQPKNELEGYFFALNILKNNQSYFENLNGKIRISEISNNVLKENLFNWGFVTAKDKLKNIFINFKNNKLLNLDVNFQKLKEKFYVNDSRNFRGEEFNSNFELKNNGNLKILMGSGMEVMNKLKLNMNNDKIKMFNAKSSDSYEVYNKKSSHLLIPGTVRFNTFPLFAIFSEEKIVSNSAFMLESGNNDIDKSIVVWINSIFIIAFLRLMFLSEEGNFGHISNYVVKSIPIPENEELLRKFIGLFDKYKDYNWPSLKNQIEEALNDDNSIRLNFDYDILKCIDDNIKKDEIFKQLREIYFEMIELINQN